MLVTICVELRYGHNSYSNSFKIKMPCYPIVGDIINYKGHAFEIEKRFFYEDENLNFCYCKRVDCSQRRYNLLIKALEE